MFFSLVLSSFEASFNEAFWVAAKYEAIRNQMELLYRNLYYYSCKESSIDIFFEHISSQELTEMIMNCFQPNLCNSVPNLYWFIGKIYAIFDIWNISDVGQGILGLVPSQVFSVD